MTSKWLTAVARPSRILEGVLLMVFFALFVYAVADWLGWLPERGYQPLQMVFLSAAMVLQPVAALVQRRSMLLCCSLLAISMALLVAVFAVGG